MINFSRTVSIDPHFELRIHRLSTRFSFFCLGFATAAWAPLIPFAQQRLNSNHGDFGFLLLFSGLGAMLAMPATGHLVKRIGCRIPIGFALILLALLLPCLALFNTSLAMAISLFLFGIAAGGLGVALNIQAVLVEKNSLRLLMSGFHGMCSLGGLAGVLSVTALLTLNISPWICAVTISTSVLILSVIAVPLGHKNVETDASQNKTSEGMNTRHLPSFLIILIGISCFIIFMTEGAAMDWGGIYLTHDYGINAAFAGLAYTFFAIAMTIGRFSGHYLIQRFGEKKLIGCGAVCSAIGLALISLTPHWVGVLLGYTLVGLGCSNIVPIMFSRAGRQHTMAKTVAMSYVSTMAYTGVLAGPALIGMLGEIVGLSTVFMLLAFMSLIIIALNHLTDVKVELSNPKI